MRPAQSSPVFGGAVLRVVKWSFEAPSFARRAQINAGLPRARNGDCKWIRRRFLTVLGASAAATAIPGWGEVNASSLLDRTEKIIPINLGKFAGELPHLGEMCRFRPRGCRPS